MHCTDFETRWLKSGGAERANHGLFLQDFCDLPGVPRPDPTTDSPAQAAYVPERAVTFEDGGKQKLLFSTKTTNFALYKVYTLCICDKHSFEELGIRSGKR